MKNHVITNNSRQLSIAITVYVIWVIGFAYFSYHSEKSNLYSQIDQQLINSARSAALILPANFHHKNMVAGELTPEQDLRNMERLSRYTDDSDITYLYTLIKHGNDIVFTSSSATLEERQTGEGLSPFFSVYDDADPRVYDVFNSDKPIFIEYEDSWGKFRSVFLPLKAHDGSTFVAAADISIKDIAQLLKNNLYQTILTSLLFLAFVYPLYVAMTRKINDVAKQLEQQVLIQNKELIENAERLTLALQTSKQGWFDIDLETGNITVNKEYPELLGYTLEDFPANFQAWQDNLHPEDKAHVLTELQNCINTKTARELEYRRKTKNGNYLWFHAIARIVEWNEDDKPIRLVGIHTDITERKQNEMVLRTLAEYGSTSDEDIFHKIVEELAQSHNVQYALIAQIDANNPERVTTLAVWATDHIDTNFSYSLANTPCQQALTSSSCFYPNDVQALFPNDTILADMNAVSYLGVPLKDKQGKIIGLIAILDDKPMLQSSKTEVLLKSLAVRVTIELERRAASEKLRLSTRVFESAHEGITITDTSGTIIDVNPTFCEITGYSREEVIGKNNNVLRSDKHSPEFFAQMWHDINNKGHWQGEIWNRKKNGDIYAQLLTISAIVDDNGQVSNYIGLFSDITPLKRQQESLELMAHYDVLTGLPNRVLFADRYLQAVAHSKRNNTMLAVCFLDLDNFKPINDRYGHDVGDQLLINVAHRMTIALREEDTVCRIGGDEFTLLIGDIESIEHCKTTINRIFDSLTAPYLINGYSIERTASCGVTLYPNDNADLDTLVRHADQAMYQAKLAGRNQFKLFDPDDDQQTSEKHERLKAIEHGLTHDQFELYYQPKVNIKTGKVFGMEALIRWQHPERGTLQPDTFLPIITGSELESTLGQWVINTALKQLMFWKSKGIELEVSVNISSGHLQSPDFFKQLEQALENYPTVNSNFLQLEILESSALGELETVSNIIKTCQEALGVQIALDDFGTGYSSLTHLRNLTAKTIKIDRSFVRDLLDDPNDYAIIDGIIGLTTSFNRELIAEGVESTEHGLMLLTMGCFELQGYGIAKPMPAIDVIAWLQSYQPNPKWLAYSQHVHTEKENRIKQFRLVSDSWINLLETAITSSAPDKKYHWPIFDQEKCHHSVWLKRSRQEQLFDDACLDRLDEAHEKLHQLSSQLVDHYQNGSLAVHTQLLDDVKAAHKQLSILIGECD